MTSTSFEGCAAVPLQSITAIGAAAEKCAAGRDVRRGLTVYSQLNMKVYRNDIKVQWQQK